MRIRNTIFSSLAGFVLVACGAREDKTQVFEQKGIRFEHPASWQTDKVDEVAAGAFSVNCEKGGFNSSGLVAISWFADSLDLEAARNLFEQQLTSSKVYKMSDVAFAPATTGTYGSHQTRQSTFKMKLLAIAHTGFINAFHDQNHTLVVLTQQADEDTAANRAGFERIARTLRVVPTSTPPRPTP